ncbi:unnamed protein product, partial [Ectocarpus fasciculatus]
VDTDPVLQEIVCASARGHAAAFAGQIDVTNYLLENRVRIDPVEARGYTPLLWAVYKGHL